MVQFLFPLVDINTTPATLVPITYGQSSTWPLKGDTTAAIAAAIPELRRGFGRSRAMASMPPQAAYWSLGNSVDPSRVRGDSWHLAAALSYATHKEGYAVPVGLSSDERITCTGVVGRDDYEDVCLNVVDQDDVNSKLQGYLADNATRFFLIPHANVIKTIEDGWKNNLLDCDQFLAVLRRSSTRTDSKKYLVRVRPEELRHLFRFFYASGSRTTLAYANFRAVNIGFKAVVVTVALLCAATAFAWAAASVAGVRRDLADFMEKVSGQPRTVTTITNNYYGEGAVRDRSIPNVQPEHGNQTAYVNEHGHLVLRQPRAASDTTEDPAEEASAGEGSADTTDPGCPGPDEDYGATKIAPCIKLVMERCTSEEARELVSCLGDERINGSALSRKGVLYIARQNKMRASELGCYPLSATLPPYRISPRRAVENQDGKFDPTDEVEGAQYVSRNIGSIPVDPESGKPDQEKLRESVTKYFAEPGRACLAPSTMNCLDANGDDWECDSTCPIKKK